MNINSSIFRFIFFFLFICEAFSAYSQFDVFSFNYNNNFDFTHINHELLLNESDPNFLVAGTIIDNGNGISQGTIIRQESDGTISWSKITSHSDGLKILDVGKSPTLGSSVNVAVGYIIYNQIPYLYFVKFDNQGNIIEEKTIDQPYTIGQRVAVDKTGNFIIVGSKSSNFSHPLNNSKGIVLKYDISKNVYTYKEFYEFSADNNSHFNDVLITNNGLVITGQIDNKAFFAELDNSLNIIVNYTGRVLDGSTSYNSNGIALTYNKATNIIYQLCRYSDSGFTLDFVINIVDLNTYSITTEKIIVPAFPGYNTNNFLTDIEYDPNENVLFVSGVFPFSLRNNNDNFFVHYIDLSPSGLSILNDEHLVMSGLHLPTTFNILGYNTVSGVHGANFNVKNSPDLYSPDNLKIYKSGNASVFSLTSPFETNSNDYFFDLWVNKYKVRGCAKNYPNSKQSFSYLIQSIISSNKVEVNLSNENLFHNYSITNVNTCGSFRIKSTEDKNISSLDIICYPSPSNGQLTIQLDDPTKYGRLIVRDITAKKAVS